MFSASVITLRNVRKSRNRVMNIRNPQPKLHNVDRQFIKILFLQVGVGAALSSFRCIFLVYSLLSKNVPKGIYRVAVESFLDQFSLIVYYLNFAKSTFFDIFRQRLIHTWKHFTKGIDFYFVI